jgi:hypothetical protein
MFSEGKWFNPGGAAFDTTLIGNSVWLDGSADFLSAELGAKTRTRAVIGCWVQKTGFSNADATIFSKKGSAQFAIRMQDQSSKGGKISIFDYDGGSFQYSAESASMVLRDHAWYHIMISIDTGASAGSRLKYYINGVDQTSTLTVATDYTASDNPSITGGSGEPTQWGVGYGGASQFIPAYLSQCFMLDDDSIQNSDVAVSDILESFSYGDSGSQFGPRADTDIAALASNAGGDSFCLNFEDGSNLGNDSSSNNNDFSVTSMSAANQSTNTPSLSYAALNILDKGSSATTSEGATRQPTGTDHVILSSMQIPPTGKWAISGRVDVADFSFGICTPAHTRTSKIGRTNDSWGAIDSPGASFFRSEHDSVGSNSTSAVSAASDTFIIAFDADSGKLWLGRNDGGAGIAYLGGGDPATGTTPTYTLSASEMSPGLHFAVGSRLTVSFGQRTHFETLPTDFLELNSANLTTPDYQGIDYFAATLYEGNGTAIGSGGKAVTGVGFKPDFTWIKNRDAAGSHILTDVVRGVTKYISSNSTAAEATNTEALSTFDTDGFTVGNLAAVNTSAENYVSWNWLAGGTSSSNTNGSINSTVTVADAGHLSIGTYTGTGANGTVGHGLTGAPEFVNVKQLNSTASWSALIPAIGNSKAIFLNLINAATTVGASYWQNTDPTSTVFSVGTDNGVNALSSTYVFQCFRSVPSVCKVGTYVGNGNSDGTYISVGFRPAYVLAKSTGAERWILHDTSRSPINVASAILTAETTSSEATLGTSGSIDILGDGFKCRDTDTRMNGNGVTYIYIAMADLGGNGTLPPIYGR